jgi:hypothetical protein
MPKDTAKPKEITSNAEPMVFETFTMPNLTNERGRLAREAATLGKDELVERAAAVGVATEGTKTEIVERVQDAARND